MLSLNSEIFEKDIARIQMLKPGVVWLLSGNGADLVIKWENLATAQASQVGFFDASKRAMGAVDQSVKDSKKLSANEMVALENFVKRQKAFVHFTLNNRIPGATQDLEAVLSNNKTAPYLWYKMPYTKMLDLDSALAARLGQKKNDNQGVGSKVDQSDGPFRLFQKTLVAASGLESLGRVIAVDMFNQNEDRVTPTGGMRPTYGQQSFDFNAIQNIGNLLLVGSGNAKTISGMDFADPTSTLRDADHAADLDTAMDDEKWWGTFIVNSAARKAFAERVVADLEAIFARGPIKESFRDRLPGHRSVLGSNAAKRLDAGMLSGAQMLAAAMRIKLTKNANKYSKHFYEQAR